MNPLKAFTDSEAAYALCNKLDQWLDNKPEYPEDDGAPAFANDFNVVEVELE